MTRRMATLRGGALAAAFALAGAVHTQSRADDAADRARCEALVDMPNLTIVAARVVEANGATPRYCYAKGAIPPGISYHVQLPLPANWNGRFLNGATAGRTATSTSPTSAFARATRSRTATWGTTTAPSPDASFALDNRQAEVDFGYRAVHMTANAAKTLIRAYYGKPASYSYFEGCSTGGREGLMEAQRYPGDFDGIVAGAPVLHYQELNAGHTWLLQRTFRNGFAGNLAYDTNGDGSFDSLKKLDMLAAAVMTQCDALDGIADGVIDDPLRCEFDPDARARENDVQRGARRRNVLHAGAAANGEGLLPRAVRQPRPLGHQGARAGRGARLGAVHSARGQPELSEHVARRGERSYRVPAVRERSRFAGRACSTICRASPIARVRRPSTRGGNSTSTT